MISLTWSGEKKNKKKKKDQDRNLLTDMDKR